MKDNQQTYRKTQTGCGWGID